MKTFVSLAVFAALFTAQALALDLPISAPKAQLASGGAYASTAVGPDIFQKGKYYEEDFPIVGPKPTANTKITTVHWRWGRSDPPAGLRVWLCHSNSYNNCADISNMGAGSTDTLANLSAAYPLRLVWYVPGSGLLPRFSYGMQDQLIVNWAY